MLRVPALASLSHEDRNKIADGIHLDDLAMLSHRTDCWLAVLQHQKFRDGDLIITEGDTRADTFYILMEGHAAAKIASVGVVREYSTGDCFGGYRIIPPTRLTLCGRFSFSFEAGELALLHSTPRAASVIAVGACSVVCIDRASFTRLLGRECPHLARASSHAPLTCTS
jgi:CRP-like cAMP-binding protein